MYVNTQVQLFLELVVFEITLLQALASESSVFVEWEAKYRGTPLGLDILKLGILAVGAPM